MFLGFALLMLAAAEPDQPTPATLPKPKLICRESEAQLGSHIRSGRRCKTAEEWQIEDQRRDATSPSMRVTTGQGDGVPQPTRPQL